MGNIIPNHDRKAPSLEARHAVPLGLYPKCPWDHRTLKKMVLEKKVAPIFKGEEDPSRDDLEECPICMLVRYATRTHTRTHTLEARPLSALGLSPSAEFHPFKRDIV